MLLHKLGIHKWFGDDDEDTDKTSERKDNKSKDTSETPDPAAEAPAVEEETPEVDAEGIDDAVNPPAEKEEKTEKNPEPQMSKTDINREVKTSLEAFTKTAKEIDSNFSMVTKNDEDIESDGKKLNDVYQKVMDQLALLNQNYPEDPEMQELYRSTMYTLAEFYSERGSVDNDHHVDPVKAVSLLAPTVNGIEAADGQKSQLPAMPTQDQLIASFNGSPLGDTIADKLAQ